MLKIGSNYSISKEAVSQLPVLKYVIKILGKSYNPCYIAEQKLTFPRLAKPGAPSGGQGKKNVQGFCVKKIYTQLYCRQSLRRGATDG